MARASGCADCVTRQQCAAVAERMYHKLNAANKQLSQQHSRLQSDFARQSYSERNLQSENERLKHEQAARRQEEQNEAESLTHLNGEYIDLKAKAEIWEKRLNELEHFEQAVTAQTSSFISVLHKSHPDIAAKLGIADGVTVELEHVMKLMGKFDYILKCNDHMKTIDIERRKAIDVVKKQLEQEKAIKEKNEKKMASLTEENKALQKKLEKAKEQETEATVALNTLMQTHDAVKLENGQLRSALNTANYRRDHLQTSIEAAQKRERNWQLHWQQLSHAMDEHEGQAQQVQAELARLRRENAALKAGHSQPNGTNGAQIQQAAVGCSDAQVQQLKRQLAAQQSSNDALRKQIQDNTENWQQRERTLQAEAKAAEQRQQRELQATQQQSEQRVRQQRTQMRLANSTAVTDEVVDRLGARLLAFERSVDTLAGQRQALLDNNSRGSQTEPESEAADPSQPPPEKRIKSEPTETNDDDDECAITRHKQPSSSRSQQQLQLQQHVQDIKNNVAAKTELNQPEH